MRFISHLLSCLPAVHVKAGESSGTADEFCGLVMLVAFSDSHDVAHLLHQNTEALLMCCGEDSSVAGAGV